jgi:hypothetical protein
VDPLVKKVLHSGAALVVEKRVAAANSSADLECMAEKIGRVGFQSRKINSL